MTWSVEVTPGGTVSMIQHGDTAPEWSLLLVDIDCHQSDHNIDHQEEEDDTDRGCDHINIDYH